MKAAIVIALLLGLSSAAFADEADEHLRLLRAAYCVEPVSEWAQAACQAGGNAKVCEIEKPLNLRLSEFVAMRIGHDENSAEVALAKVSGKQDAEACGAMNEASCKRMSDRCSHIDSLLPY